MSVAVHVEPESPYEVAEEDVPYAASGDDVLLARIFRPASSDRSRLRPVIVEAHGGAWANYDRTAGALVKRRLAAQGLVVVALDFRQGPDHHHPAASADIAAGIRFVRANAAALGVDPRRLGLMGSSSGGHLALLAAIRPNAPEHRTTPILMPDGNRATADEIDARPGFVLALWPVSDPIARYRYALGRRNEPVEEPPAFNAKALIRGHESYFATEEAMAEASIPRIVAAGEAECLPPAWVAQPELDQNVPTWMTDRLIAAWRGAGGHMDYSLYHGQGHAFTRNEGPATDRCIGEALAFIARELEHIEAETAAA